MMDFMSQLEKIKGIGPKTSEALSRRGLRTLKDLFYYFPRDYEDYQAQTKISDIQPGKVILRGQIRHLRNLHTRRRNFIITQGEIFDETGAVRVVWYNQPYRIKNFSENTAYYFTGQYDFKYNRYQLTAPTAVIASEIEQKIEGFQPIYSTKGNLTSSWFKKLFEKLRPYFASIPDFLPQEHAPAFIYPGARSEALYKIHFPKQSQDVAEAKKYLSYEEIFELLLASQLNRQETQRLRALSLSFNLEQTKSLLGSLKFKLTAAQKAAGWDILQDLAKDTPMNRLLQGDVGSGKTVVAALAIFQAIRAGAQVALLAPTSILASQHAENLGQILSPFGIRIGLLTSTTKQKEHLKVQIKDGTVDLIIGTHAILTDDTIFHRLALCIVDEQHRFGVGQRQKLLAKIALNASPDSNATAPHFLAMTATPIPRSLQLTVFGDLDISVINQMPQGRQPIQTKIINEVNMKESLYPEILEHLNRGEQIYWICRLIDSSDDESSTGQGQSNVKDEFKRLRKIFPQARIGLLHGKLKPREKDQVMLDFKNHQLDLLVSTTVVEVGVDVPNATQIVIMNADRFGLAQVHQLRGRVGRGNQPSQCFLVTTGDNPPSARLRELEKSSDGFYLAEVDLKMRGPGEVYGFLQHGELDLRIANLSDTQLIAEARRQVQKFISSPQNMLEYKELSQSIQKYQQLTTLN